MATKVCKDCEKEKDITEFYKGRGICKYCDSANSKEYYQTHKEEIKNRVRLHKRKYPEVRKKWDKENPEKIKAQNRRYYIRNKDKRAKYQAENKERISNRDYWYRIKKTYGITKEDYWQMFDEQGGCCPICKASDVSMCVDHNHETGTVRGLLCGPCNKGIGFLKDNIDILNNAIEYLEKN